MPSQTWRFHSVLEVRKWNWNLSGICHEYVLCIVIAYAKQFFLSLSLYIVVASFRSFALYCAVLSIVLHDNVVI